MRICLARAQIRGKSCHGRAGAQHRDRGPVCPDRRCHGATQAVCRSLVFKITVELLRLGRGSGGGADCGGGGGGDRKSCSSSGDAAAVDAWAHVQYQINFKRFASPASTLLHTYVPNWFKIQQSECTGACFCASPLHRSTALCNFQYLWLWPRTWSRPKPSAAGGRGRTWGQIRGFTQSQSRGPLFGGSLGRG